MKSANEEYSKELLRQYQPTVDFEQLIQELNLIYHSVEAKQYDLTHDEVSQQLPPLWKQMTTRTFHERGFHDLRVLDFGCGTGFESDQLLKYLPPNYCISYLACYDPSYEMIEQCKSKISPLIKNSIFTIDKESIFRTEKPFNVLITNSLLHHLHKPISAINSLLPVLSDDAIWLAGHEPSKRFYSNPECARVYEAYLKERKWRKFFHLKSYLDRFNAFTGLQINPASRTGKEAYRLGLFKKIPSPSVIDRIVDFNVAHSAEEVIAGRGFDHVFLQQDLKEKWKLDWMHSYSFMGCTPEYRLPRRWRKAASYLRNCYPNDGANFCCIWRRA